MKKIIINNKIPKGDDLLYSLLMETISKYNLLNNNSVVFSKFIIKIQTSKIEGTYVLKK